MYYWTQVGVHFGLLWGVGEARGYMSGQFEFKVFGLGACDNGLLWGGVEARVSMDGPLGINRFGLGVCVNELGIWLRVIGDF